MGEVLEDKEQRNLLLYLSPYVILVLYIYHEAAKNIYIFFLLQLM